MRSKRWIWALVLWMGLVPSGLAQMARNSFLTRPANSKPELVAQIRDNSAVADKYMRHFGMSKDEVLKMVDGLTLDRLDQDGVFVVYNVPKWQEVRQRAMFYKKGTLVWKDKAGEPVLKASCGNPMVRGTDIGVSAVSPDVTTAPVADTRELVAIETPQSIPTEEAAALLAPPELEANMADAPPILPDSPPVPPAAVAPTPLEFVPFLIAIVVVRPNDRNPVPEPGPLLAFGGLGAMFLVRRVKRS